MGPVASLAAAIVPPIIMGLFGSKPGAPPQHLYHAPAAISQEHQAAIEDARRKEAAAKTEADKLRAEVQRLANQKALEQEMRKPVTTKELINEARVKLGIDPENFWNVIFCGETGTGKSYTLGAIYGLVPGTDTAPPVSVKECTMDLKRYLSPSLAHLALWDAPGCGTGKFPFYHPTDPTLNYYRRFCIYAFHLVVLFSADRLTQGAVELAKMCFQANQPVIIVRNKADRMVEDMVDNGQATDLEDAKSKALGIFEDDLVQNLGSDLATRIPHFLISMKQYRRGQLDFGETAFVQAMAAAARGHVTPGRSA